MVKERSSRASIDLFLRCFKSIHVNALSSPLLKRASIAALDVSQPLARSVDDSRSAKSAWKSWEGRERERARD